VPPITWSDVESLDSSLSTVDVGFRTVVLGRVEQLSSSFFGGVDSPSYKLARMLLAAHIVAPIVAAAGGGGAGPAGPVTSESEGGVSRSYAMIQGAALHGSHSTTVHGRAFDDLVRSMPGQLGTTS
jgi:hypothetical protein